MEIRLQNLTKTFPCRDRKGGWRARRKSENQADVNTAGAEKSAGFENAGKAAQSAKAVQSAESVQSATAAQSVKSGQDVVAVNDFTFTIPDGKLIGLLGPSGCGKSTTLNLISGLLAPTSGRIFFGEDDVTELPPEHRGIGLVFQNYALYPHLTVRQNILFPLENRKGKDRLTKTQMLEMADEVARLVQIDTLMERKPGELSGGQQQRVAIARALVKQPRVLLLDEPLSNLDARLRLQTREEIRRIQRETGITTIFVTHDQDEAMSISDQIVVMKDGVVQQTGRPQEVYDSPANLFVAKFLGTPPINVFEGHVQGGVLYIGTDALPGMLEIISGESGQKANVTGNERQESQKTSAAEKRKVGAAGSADREVWVGIRPEGFLLQEDGPLCCDLSGVEVMGRDVSVLSQNKASVGRTVRSIISTDNKVDTSSATVRFALRPEKVFLFDKVTEERI
ncbi:MAG: ABC transporter ATP-binding protein [Lachnospiraceae bacterium]|nr:ABC transporter ATP-binding protein [Lachnospiraceae bacterium]